MKKIVCLACLMVPGFVTYCSEPLKSIEMLSGNGSLTLTILYNNYLYNNDLKTRWGFSCLIEGLEKTILFDTGDDDGIMLSNMAILGKDPADVDIVVLSHIHADHTGGLMDFLKKNSDVTVYVPLSFPAQLKENIKASGARLTEVTGPVRIMDRVSTTGEMGSAIIEQSLILSTGKGSILLTGCAHPGIEKIVTRSKELSKEDILLVMGGFHLLSTGKEQVRAIAENFYSMNIRYVAPTHCTGDGAISEFRDIFGDRCLTAGAGRVIVVDEL